MKHYDETELSLYALDPDGFEERGALESHLRECAQCTRNLELEQNFDAELRDGIAWSIADEMALSAGRKVPEALLRLAQSIEQQRAEATSLLMPHLSSPIRFAEASIGVDPQFRTPAVVDVLVRHAAEVRDSQPQFALALAGTAIDIATTLPNESPFSNSGLLARAWVERAIALGMIGKFADAEHATHEAERLYEEDPRANAHDLAIVWLARAVICEQTGRIVESEVLSRACAFHFLEFGDTARYLKARLATANVLLLQESCVAAAAELKEVVTLARARGERRVLLRALHNLGETHVAMGEHEAAIPFFLENLALADELGDAVEKTRAVWSLGNVFLVAGDFHEALARLNEAVRDFDGMGVVNDAALVRLQIAETLLAAGRPDEVAPVLDGVVVTFAAEGLTRNAMLAVAYLREAAAEGRLAREHVADVRAYLSGLPTDPQSVFTPRH